MKTANRIRGTVHADGRVSWQPAEGRPDVDVDGLMEHNYWTMTGAAEMAIRQTAAFVRREAS